MSQPAIRRGLGWRPNRPGEYPQGHHLLASRVGAVPPLSAPSLRKFRGAAMAQGNASSCVAFATVRCLQLFFAANDLGTDVRASPLQLYHDGRREEWAGAAPETVPPLDDAGTEPALMMSAIQGLGFVPWDAYPYSDDPQAIAAEPPPAIYEQGYDQRGLQWGLVDPSDPKKLERVSDALRHRLPVMFGLLVDQAFLQNRGEIVSGIDPNSIAGGHMLSVLEIESDGTVVFDNWWDSDWGDGGIGRLSAGLFSSPEISDVTIIQAAPLFRQAVSP